LKIRGRKKEMIVTPEGLKVFPEDVEKILNATPGVKDSAVIGRDRVHAVFILDPDINADEIVRAANQKLEDQQKIRSFSIWQGEELPRTQSTRKLRRAEIAQTIRNGAQPTAKHENPLLAILQKYAPGRTITPQTTLDELGLSSLDRVQLMLELEQARNSDLDESAFVPSATVADLEKPAPARPEPIHFPTYNRSLFARAIRRLALPFWLLPLARFWASIHVSGRENLASIHRPVIFASNHQSHFDVPVILAALPARFRYRLSTAMSKEFFDKHFYPQHSTWREWFTNSLNYWLSTFFFNTFPLPQRHSGAGQTIRYMGELNEQGWSVLIFPEGDRTDTGEILKFQPGVAMIASHLNTPVIPVRIIGVDRVLHKTWYWPRHHRVDVKFGRPLTLTGENFTALAAEVESAVRAL
jgi:long-chain acyl-CoA synthetase